MLYGLYQSAQGIQAQSSRIDVIANNLANASTSGFKRDLAIFQSNRPYDLDHGGGADPPSNQNALSGGVTTAGVVTDYSPGPLVRTGSAYDVALTGHGFFQLNDGRQNYLTRNGQFTISPIGELISQGSGMRVQSSTGQPIFVPPEATRIDIGADGMVSWVGTDGDQTQIAKLSVVQPLSESQLQKSGNSLYRYGGRVAPAETLVKQGFVEGSGVKPVSEMVDMIQASRVVEANVNMIKFQDDALDRLLQAATPH